MHFELEEAKQGGVENRAGREGGEGEERGDCKEGVFGGQGEGKRRRNRGWGLKREVFGGRWASWGGGTGGGRGSMGPRYLFHAAPLSLNMVDCKSGLARRF